MTSHLNYQPIIYTTDISIANGQTISGNINLAGTTLCGIHMPAAFTGTSVTFQTAPTLDGTYQVIQKNGVDLSYVVTASRYIVIDPADFTGTQFLRIVSSGAEAAARTLSLAVRPF
ncbi:MAG: hypothetical protein K2Q12_08315 [Rickettsiales bacterium]|nr:hypothetical protein [Rickettsiales bacterium]